MDNEQIVMSKYAFERMQTKDEKNDRWRNVTIIILIVLLVVTNAMWLIAWNQYDYTEEYTSLEADDGSNANFIGHNGDINNGSKDNSQDTDKGSQ